MKALIKNDYFIKSVENLDVIICEKDIHSERKELNNFCDGIIDLLDPYKN